MKFAAVDIGSNAIRLLIAEVLEDKNKTIFNKEALFRVPIRLGSDVFVNLNHKISAEKITDLIKTLKAFKMLAELHHPLAFRTCATSALREANNSQEVVAQVLAEAGVKIEILDGKSEAETIFSLHVEENLDKQKSYLYIDVGGGSTELTLFAKDRRITSRSFNVGTIRILENISQPEEWDLMKKWVKDLNIQYRPLIGIGTGGNINKIFKISGRKNNEALNTKVLKSIHEQISSYTLDERIKILGLRKDRADVIVPAGHIYLSILKWADINKLFVPKLGLADGIVHGLYEEYKKKKP